MTVEENEKQGKGPLSERQKIVLVAAGAALVPILCLLVAALKPGLVAPSVFLAVALIGGAVGVFLAAKIAGTAFDQQSSMLDQVRAHAREIASADTEALELTIKMIGSIQEGVTEAQNAAGIVSSLEENTRAVAGTSEQMSTNVNVVATAAEEISANINSTAATAEEISSSMSSVATTVEEMSSNS